MVFSFPLRKIVLMVVLVFVPGYARILWEMDDQARTGHSVTSPERCMVTDSWRSSDFEIRKSDLWCLQDRVLGNSGRVCVLS